jgi:hypothetical protein
MLNPLTNIGNFTFVNVPMAGSPVIDAGNQGDCTAVDQRDIERPIDGDGNGSVVCDLGSIEVANPDIIFKDGFDD